MWGFIDREGNLQITPQFESVASRYSDPVFSDPYAHDLSLYGGFGPNDEPAMVRKGGLWGAIDKEGKWVVKPEWVYLGREYDSAGRYYFNGVNRNEELSKIGSGDWHQVVLAPQVTHPELYNRKGQWQSLFPGQLGPEKDRDGRVIVNYSEQMISGTRYRKLDSTEAFLAVVSDSGVGLVLASEPDSAIVPPIYYDVSSLSSSLFLVIQLSEHNFPSYQVVDKSGRLLLPEWASYIHSPINGRFIVGTHKREWVIDTAGVLYFNERNFHSIWFESPEIFKVAVEIPDTSSVLGTREIRGMANLDGIILVEPTWSNVNMLPGTDTLFQVTDENGATGVISHTDRVVVYPAYCNRIDYLPNGILRIDVGGNERKMLIGTDGQPTDQRYANCSDVDNGHYCEWSRVPDTWKHHTTYRIRDLNHRVILSTDTIAPDAAVADFRFGSRRILLRVPDRTSRSFYPRNLIYYSFDGIPATPRFEDGYGFSEGMAAVKSRDSIYQRERWGYIDTNGTYIILPQFDCVGPFSEGKAPAAVKVADELKWGYINREGDWLIEPEFDGARPFHNGCAAIMMESGEGERRDWRIPQSLTITELTAYRGSIASSSSDYFLGPSQDQLWGYIDTSGAVIVPTIYHDVDDFSDSVGKVYGGGKPYLVNTRGREIRMPNGVYVRLPFSNGLAPAPARSYDRNKPYYDLGYGFVNRQGEWAIRPIFTTVRAFREGHAVVENQDYTARFYYVDDSGRIIWDGRAESGLDIE